MGGYVVTGAGGGMGRAICRRLSEEGFCVWGIDRQAAEGVGWTCITADVTDPYSLGAAFERIRSEAGSLDGIIHAAGVYDLNSLVEMPEKDFLLDFDVNLFGVFRINQLFLPLLRSGGRIVILSSELAPLEPLPFTGVYAVTKAAVDKYASALRMELQLLEHSVIVIRPGAVKTDMLSVSTEKLDQFCNATKLYRCNAARFKRIVDRVEARNIPPERIADVIYHSLTVKRPRLKYNVNRNPLLLLFRLLPVRVQLKVIRRILA